MKRKYGKIKRASRRRPINVLASAITIFSLYFGLASIFWSIRENYVVASYLIFFALICDMFDGTVARITNSTSEFGKELDSLCDLVSFGVAPAVLIYHAYWQEYESRIPGAIGRTGSVMAIVFVICAALRLARYNVFQSATRDSFTGLPSPAAGGAIAAFVLFANYYDLHVAFYVLGPLTLMLAYLMVSTIRYPKDRIKKVFIATPANAFRLLVFAVIVVAVFHYAITHDPAIVLFPVFMTYVMFGIGEEVLVRLKVRRGAQEPVQVSAAPVASGALPPGAGSGTGAGSNNADRL
jgi:CDP-diacylglycerol--serine O-phosphatidyltransferase